MLSIIYGNVVGIVFALVFISILVLLNKKFSYFADLGLPYVRLSWIDFFKHLPFSKLQELPLLIYDKESRSRLYVGYFQYFTPSILVLDPALVQNILIKDFSYFQDHGSAIDVKVNPLLGHLFTMVGDEWRTLRHKLVPTFTSGKLRGMVPVMENCADSLIKEIKQDSSLRQNTNIKELFKVYTLDVIAMCAFGIDPAGIKDPNCEFRQVMNKVLTPSTSTQIKFMLTLAFPNLSRILKLHIVPQDIDEFFLNFTRQSFEMRRKSGVKNNDFIQLLLELKDKGEVDIDMKDLEQDEKESIDKMMSEQPPTKLEMTDELLMAQVFVFIFGGYENTAYLAAITFYVLSKHPEIQKKVREEVKEVGSKHNVLDYQALRDAKFLDACLNEALRLYSPVITLMRECTKTYTMSDGLKIKKGTMVVIPSRSFHLDAKYWSNPEKFNPYRFLDGNSVQPGVFMPFGDGPRICIAQRMALIVVKMVVAKLLEQFELLPSDKTKEPLKVSTLGNADVEGGLWGSLNLL